MKRWFREWKMWFLTIVIAVLTISPPSYGADTAAADQEPVRVGYVKSEGFISQDYNGGYFGYGVTYLSRISQYTGWEYELIQESWEDCLKDLEAGRIDMVCSANWTEERAEKFAYTDSPIGREYMVVYTQADNDQIYYKDYQSMDGAKVAMVKGFYQNEEFAEYAGKKGFQFEKMEYSKVDEAAEALRSGQADLAVFGSLRKQDGFKIVDKLSPIPFYIIMSKNNNHKMEMLNTAIENIHAISPYFEEKLNQEFFENNSTAYDLMLTREEAEYIENMEPLRVACIGGFYPLSYRDETTGEPAGIYPALTTKIGEMSGLKLVNILVPDGSSPEEMILEGKADLVTGVPHIRETAQNSNVQLTSPIISQPVMLVVGPGAQGKKYEDLTLALPFYYRSATNSLPEEFQNCKFVFKDTTKACYDAVINKEAAATLQNTHVANFYTQIKSYQELKPVYAELLDEKSCIMAPAGGDSRLISVLEKTINCLSTEMVNQTVMEYTISQPYLERISDVLYYYRIPLGILFLLAVFAIMVLIVLNRRHTKIMLELKEKETYRMMAETDEMTGLLNRKTFYARAEEKMKENPDKKYQILYFNVENFKIVNDLFGVKEGDQLLKFLARQIREWSDSHEGVCGRFEADHYVVCVEINDGFAEEAIDRIKCRLDTYHLDMVIDVSCGVYLVQEEDYSVAIMCDRAHLALNSIKGNHVRHVSVYDDSNRKALIYEQLILSEMYTALKEKQFHVYLQPQYNMTTEEVIGAEALVRWKHPRRGIIPPGEFIPIFEHNGFISQLDAYMFEETCKLIAGWREQGLKLLPVSVNLSRVSFYNPKLCENLCATLEKYQLPINLLELELTETAYASDSKVIHDHLQELRDHGFRVLMDDFGSGYSSLNMLKEAPVDLIKLDMRFLSASDPYKRAEPILETVIAMGKKISIPILVEGVENKWQAEMLKSYSCNLAQGYYYSRPLAVEDYEKLIGGGAEESDDWTDPKVWKKATPSLDITVGMDKVKAACESAKQNPGEENSFRQLRLNQCVKQAVRWMPMDKWDACSFKVDEEDLEGRVCYGGFDLSFHNGYYSICAGVPSA